MSEVMRRTNGLTDRELDVLELAMSGLTNAQIAARLYLSVDTVKTHFRRIYLHLGAAGALHAVTLALGRGWLVYDPVARTLGRPDGRRSLPAYARRAA